MHTLSRHTFFLGALLALGCSTTTTDNDDETGETLRLRISGLETTAGEASDGRLPVGCSEWATITFGPSEDAGILDRFTLSPPGSCTAETDACGYIEFTVASDGSEPVRTATILTETSFELPLAGANLEVSAKLIQGKSLEAFRNPDGREVTVSATYTLDRDCSEGLGGMGGGR